jgi:transposase
MTEIADLRDQRALALLQAKRGKFREVVAGKYIVPSQGTAGSYFVDVAEATCTCLDHAENGHKCKHVRAVLLLLAQAEVRGVEAVPEVKKKTYPQNWPAYRAGRMNEKDVFARLLSSLCAGIEQPQYKGNGRPRLPLADVIFSGAMKVYTGMSADLATSDIRASRDRGLVEVVPHPNTVLRVLRAPETVAVLRALIEESAAPLRRIETDFAPDATGFSTCSYVRWFDKKWGKDRREKKWLKLHLMIGVKTQIISAAEVTPGNVHDHPMVEKLIDQTTKNFEMREFYADKGYLSHETFARVVKTGAIPYIPFKANSRGDTKDPLWNRLHAMFTCNEPEWRSHYHHRSLAESTFSSIKRVLGSAVAAKTYEGQVAEVYLKVLAHNIRMVVQSMFELGVNPTFWGEAPAAAVGGVS